MIKVVAFDFVGVLVNEKNIKLSDAENKLERMFGPNLNDNDYLCEARKIIKSDLIIMSTTENLINKLYKVKDKDIFKRIKEKYCDVKLIIATNHLSFIRNFACKSFDVTYLDDIIISADIHKIKPNKDFYQYILDKYEINPKELLFIDDNSENIGSAKEMGISTIKAEKNTNIIKEIDSIFNSLN